MGLYDNRKKIKNQRANVPDFVKLVPHKDKVLGVPLGIESSFFNAALKLVILLGVKSHIFALGISSVALPILNIYRYINT